MERNSVLRAKTWAGKWVTICDESVPIHEQRQKFFSEFRPLTEHTEYCLIKMQDSDSPAFYHAIHKKTETKNKKN